MKNIFIQRYLAEKLTLKKMAGNLVRLSSTLAKSSIQLNPYQIQAVKYAFDSPLQRGAILADEVGLGKTIEAAIVISQLWAEGKRKILIISPASIRKQWQDELLTRFGLESEVIDGPTFSERVNSGQKVPLTYDGIFIVSLQFCYGRIGLIEKQLWNCIVIDEAHRLRNVYKGRDASKMAWEIRKVILSAPKLLLTATPLQNNLMELYGIVSFIDDKLLGTKYSFKKRFVDPISGDSRETKITTKAALRSLIKGDENAGISGVLIRSLRKQVAEYVKFTERKALTQDFVPTDEEMELYNKVSSYLQRPKLAAIQHTQRNLMILVYRKLLASSSFAIAATLRHLIDSLKTELMLRETDRINSEKEKPDLFSEEDLIENLEEVDVEKIEKSEEKLSKSTIDQEEFSDEDIQKEIDELQSYYQLAMSIEKNSKGEALVKALKAIFPLARKNHWPEKFIVFTESTRTQEYLKKLLEQNNITCTIFNGSNNSKDAHQAFKIWQKEFPEAAEKGTYNVNIRQALIYNFQTRTKVFLSTEAGGEGLNLQFCNIVVNYDLPWNPQRVEQRIGRCHRYGQKYEVLVVNFLNTKNRADQRVLELLQQKLHLFDGLFGSSDEVLGLLESGIDFERRILDIYQACRTPEEIDAAFDRLQKSVQSKISEKIISIRSQLTEYLDEPVRELFQRTRMELGKILNAFDRDLLRLCKYHFDEKLQPLDKEETLFFLKDKANILAFRELKEDEIGKIPRMNKEHPLAQEAIALSLKMDTSPIPVNYFFYSDSDKRYTPIEPLVGKEGLIYLFKLRIRGVEIDELLVPLAFIQKEKDFQSLPLETAENVLSLRAEQQRETLSSSPIDKEKLLNIWGNWKKSVLDKYQHRNERLYDREIDRINRYYQDYSLRVDDRIVKLEDEKIELNRRRDNSVDYEQRRQLHRRIQEIELTLDKLRIEQIKLKQESNQLKRKEYEELEKKFQLRTEEGLIAVTKFKIF